MVALAMDQGLAEEKIKRDQLGLDPTWFSNKYIKNIN
jgi:hypothetical protein